MRGSRIFSAVLGGGGIWGIIVFAGEGGPRPIFGTFTIVNLINLNFPGIPYPLPRPPPTSRSAHDIRYNEYVHKSLELARTK